VANSASDIEQFLEAYRRESACNDRSWRVSDISVVVCRKLLESGFHPDVLLLNNRVPLEVLADLAAHPDPRIRSLVAMRRASAPILMRLAQDAQVSVRLRVAYNGKAPEDVLQKLSGDSDAEVRKVADERLRALQAR
jgi:hypothetical protein